MRRLTALNMTFIVTVLRGAMPLFPHFCPNPVDATAAVHRAENWRKVIIQGGPFLKDNVVRVEIIAADSILF